MKNAGLTLLAAALVLAALPALAGEDTFDRWHFGARVGPGQVVNSDPLDREVSFYGGAFLETPFLGLTTAKLEFSSDVLLAKGSETASFLGLPFRAERDGYLISFKADALVFPFYAPQADESAVEVAQPYLLGGIGWMHPSFDVTIGPHPARQQAEDSLDDDPDSFIFELGAGVQFALGPRGLADLRVFFDLWSPNQLGDGMWAIALGLAY